MSLFLMELTVEAGGGKGLAMVCSQRKVAAV
jgi:hypothetical protein